jgi:hypothetical protein
MPFIPPEGEFIPFTEEPKPTKPSTGFVPPQGTFHVGEEAPAETVPQIAPVHVGGARVQGKPLPGIPLHRSVVTDHMTDADLGSEGGHMARNLGHTLLQGMALGWGDEAYGTVNALVDTLEGQEGSFQDRYLYHRDRAREHLAEVQKEHPWLAMGTEAAGAIPTFALTGGMGSAAVLPRVQNLFTRFILRPMVAGATTGAVTGAGKVEAKPEKTLTGLISEETPTSSGKIAGVEEVARGMLEQGASGAALGGVGSGVLRLTGEAGRLGARITRMLRDPTKAAQLRVADALLAKEPNLTIPEAIQKARDYLAEGGDEVAMLADYSPGQGLARVVATFPGEARETALGALTARGEVAGQRTQARLKRALMISPDREYGQRMVEMAAEKRVTGPLWDTYRASPVTPTAELTRLADNPDVKSAMRAAVDDVTSEFHLAGRAPPADPLTSPEVLHRTKMFLEQKALIAKRAGENIEKRRFDSAAHQWADEVDTSVGGTFKPALKAFATPARIETAMEEGRKHAFQMKPHEIKAAMTKLSPDEREAFRLGMIERVREGQRGDLGTPVGFISSPERMARLQSVAPSTQRQVWLKAIRDREQEYTNTFQRIFRGSKTAEIGAEREVAETVPVEAFKQIMTSGNLRTALIKGLGALNAWSKAINPKQRQEIAKIMFATGEDAQAALTTIEQSLNNGFLSARNAGRLASMVGRHAPVIGSAVRNP